MPPCPGGILHCMKLSQAIKEFVELRSSKGPRSRKTAARYQITLRIFCLCMQDPELEEIDLAHIVWYFSELGRLGWKPNGMNLIGIGLKAFFGFCHLRGYPIAFNEELIPIREKEFNIPRVSSLKDFKKVLAQVPANTNHPNQIRNRAFLQMLWGSPARSGEICNINEADLRFNKDGSGRVYSKIEKSRGRRPLKEIFWTAETGKAIKRWIKKKRELQKVFTFENPEALFVTITKSPNSPIRGRRMNPVGVAEMMRVLSNSAGLPVVHNAHSVRHSFGRDTLKVLKSDAAVSNQLGHANLESSRIYTMLFGEDLKREWKAVAKRRGSPLLQKPPRSSTFPVLRRKQYSRVPSQYMPVMIKTSRTARFAR